MAGRSTKAKVAGKAVRGAGKASGGTGKALLSGGAQGRVARKAARGAGKAALKGGKAGKAVATSSGGTGRARYLKYGLAALAGFAVGALIARSEEKEVGSGASSFTGTTGPGGADPGSPAAQRGVTWGSETPLGTAATSSLMPEGDTGALRQDTHVAEPPFQRPDGPHDTGTGRDYSDPSSGPLIGRDHDRPARPPGMPEQHEEVENRIRTRVGEDPRTRDVPHLNVEVNDEVAEIRGNAPSEEAKQAITEIASETEGVGEVRNLMIVDPQNQTPGNQTPGTAAPDRP